MVKAYLKYEPQAVLGVVVSGNAQPAALFDKSGKIAITAALENVALWEIKRGVQVALWRGDKHEVTVLAMHPDGSSVAVGYADGSIQIWSYPGGFSNATFNGHRGAISALRFDQTGARLVSGSKDTDVIVWDVVGERGLYRLRGHKDMVTSCLFLSHGDQLLTTSKDTLIKLWDLTTQHCVETLVAHRTEVWSIVVSADETLLVSGSSDAELQLWSIDTTLLGQQLNQTSDDGQPVKAISLIGSVQRTAASDRVVLLRFIDENSRIIACQTASKNIELFQAFSAEEAEKKAAKRQQRQQSKEQDSMEIQPAVLATDRLSSLHVIRATGKIASIDTLKITDKNTLKFQLLVSLHSNSIETYLFSASLTGKNAKIDSASCTSALLTTLDLEGHRSDVRCLALSSDDQLLCSGSNKAVKVWSLRTRSCIRTLESGYALCAAFTPGNRHVVIGTKTGQLELYDLSSSTTVFSIDAHTGAVWSIALTPDGKGLVSGSADHDVKFWEFELTTSTNEDQQIVRNLTLVHVRTLKMSDDVLCVRCSADAKLLAVSLLDATVKVFFLDTLKFFLSLYGHKLPVLSMDISSDNTLLVTGSADKSVKLWGLDFGDCHRSLLAHADSIMTVQFVPNTHYFFSCSKDKLVKYWDGDKFENIMKLEGHHAEVWALVISRLGDFVVSGSHDRSIRIWKRSEEQLFLEEEREKEMEALFEAGAAAEDPRETQKDDNLSSGKATIETVRAGERIIEAVDLALEEQQKWEDYEQEVLMATKLAAGGAPPAKIAAPTPHPLLLASDCSSGSHYVLHVVSGVKSSELEEALVVLPFPYVTKLLSFVDDWIGKGWRLELSCRVLFFLLHIHQDQIIANTVFRPMLDSIRTKTRAALSNQKDVIGFNLAGLQFMKRQWEANSTANFFQVAEKLDGKKKIKKPRLIS